MTFEVTFVRFCSHHQNKKIGYTIPVYLMQERQWECFYNLEYNSIS